jgi:hypothetical protein
MYDQDREITDYRLLTADRRFKINTSDWRRGPAYFFISPQLPVVSRQYFLFLNTLTKKAMETTLNDLVAC